MNSQPRGKVRRRLLPKPRVVLAILLLGLFVGVLVVQAYINSEFTSDHVDSEVGDQDGVPLAIELAAARTRLLDPGALLARLARSMDALGTGPADMPERQRTLRATVEWSVGLLDDPERSLLEIVAIFADGWTIDAAARVAGLGEDEALELTEALARHSLIQLGHTGLGPRCRMLETVREFISERLANRADAEAAFEQAWAPNRNSAIVTK